jgi:hypothetical protein
MMLRRLLPTVGMYLACLGWCSGDDSSSVKVVTAEWLAERGVQYDGLSDSKLLKVREFATSR